MYIEIDKTQEVQSLIKNLEQKIDTIRRDADVLEEVTNKMRAGYNAFVQLFLEIRDKKITGQEYRLPEKPTAAVSVFTQSKKITPKTATRGGKQWRAWEINLLKAWKAGNVRQCDKHIDYLVRKFGRTEESIRHKLRDIKGEQNVGKTENLV